MTGTVNIVKASAGSGKTYRLTQDYLSEILDEGRPWKNVLAVTFTNKATAEMKGRIVEALAAEAAKDGDRGARAKAVLREMLFDYGDFGVSTIDSFLQGTMRAFAREAGQQASYRVELDEETALDEVTDRVVAAAAKDPALMRRLRGLALRQVEKGKTWNITPTVKEMARRFLDEQFLLGLRREGSIVTDADATDALAERVDAAIRTFEEDLLETGRKGLIAMEAMGREPESFKGKSRGPLTVFRRWAAGEIKEPGARYRDAEYEVQGTPLEIPYSVAAELFGEPWTEYRTAKLVRDNISLMALYAEIFRQMDAWLDENNVTLLRRSGARLAEMLTERDAQYVQEKTGRRIDTLLLDEAQDTSVLQWENMRAVAAGAARRGTALVIGDIKQSIYRWRGSDWRLLGGTMQADLAGNAIRETSLDQNWRSGRAIVEFNNRLFGGAAGVLAAAGLTDIAARVEAVYDGCAQAVPAARREKAEDGQVTVRLIGDDDWKATAMRLTTADIRRLHDEEGYPYGAITVLVRRNSDGGAVAEALIAEGLPVVTDDSLRIGANSCAGRFAALLRHRANPEDEIAALACSVLGVADSLGASGSLYETVAQLVQDARPQAQDAPFVQAILDGTMQWQQEHGSDIAAFARWWDEDGSRRSLGAPEGRDAVRVMTIHKAKGLSLDAVIVPLAAEAFTPAAMLAPTIWCRARGDLAPLGLVPLKAYEASLRGTAFEDDFLEERTCQWIDAMNTMYVATTRARTRLLMYMPEEVVSAKAPARFSELLQTLFHGEFSEDGTYVSGTAKPYGGEPPRAATAPLAPLQTVPRKSRLLLALPADEYFKTAAETETA